LRRFIGVTEVMTEACVVVLSGLNTQKEENHEYSKDKGILIAVTGRVRK